MVTVVGIGPGNIQNMTGEAVKAIQEADVIIGYKTYIDLIKDLIQDKEVVVNGMRAEVERCQKAIDLSREGKKVAVISSGDPGIYGMAGLVYELSDERDEIKIIPGVTASSAAAALLGAPLMHDFCNISLSDLLTPYDTIMKRIRFAAESDFVICLYNPRSKGRKDHLQNAVESIMAVQGGQVPVGLVKDAGRDGESIICATLETLPYEAVDMTTVVIIGNSQTKQMGKFMVTPRGYQV